MVATLLQQKNGVKVVFEESLSLSTTTGDDDCKHELTYRNLCCTCGVDTSANSSISGDNMRSCSPTISLDWMLGVCPASFHGIKANPKICKDIFVKDYKTLVQHKKLRLVLDFDETLVHTIQCPLPSSHKEKSSKSVDNIRIYKDVMEFDCMEDALQQADLVEPQLHHTHQNHTNIKPKGIEVNDEAEYITCTLGNSLYKVYLRPYLRQFLNEITRYYDVYIYTHGTDRYARRVLELLSSNSEGIAISGIFARQSASKVRSLKQLHKMLCKRSMSIVVDDRIDVWCRNDEDNVIQISPFKGSSQDQELSFLTTYLIQIHSLFFAKQQQQQSNSLVDVRNVLKQFSRADLHTMLDLSASDASDFLLDGSSFSSISQGELDLPFVQCI